MSCLETGNTITASAGVGGFGSGQFADPFMDMASLAMPKTIQDALAWAEFLFVSDGPYAQIMRRIASYFITDVEILGDDVSREEKDKYREFLVDTLDIYSILFNAALDYLCYGNAFLSVLVPFRRSLGCRGCGSEFPFRTVQTNQEFAFKWNFSSLEFTATCPKCHKKGALERRDRRSNEESDVFVKRWNPHEMEVLFDQLHERIRYVWKIPATYRRDVQQGVPLTLEGCNWDIVKTIQANCHLQFDDGVIFHMKDAAPAGTYARGWGFPRALTHFRQAWYVRILQRYNEAIALDHVLPFRVITPSPRPGGSDISAMDPVLGQDLGMFTGQVNRMLAQHRRDPATWHTCPFPLQYQALGGDATQLAPKDLLDQGLDNLYNACGIPAQLYRGDLTIQQSPTALRIFEATHTPLVHNLNALLCFICEQVSELFNWKPVRARLTRTTVADDLNKQMAALQMMTAQQVSRTTGLKTLGLNFEDEQRRMQDEERFIAERQQKMQEEMEQEQQGQAMQQSMAPTPMQADPNLAAQQGGQQAAPQGGAAAAFSMQQPTQSNVPVTPQELLAKAQQIAQTLAAMPDGQRRSELLSLRRSDPTLHAIVKSELGSLESKASTIGKDQVLQQQFGKAGDLRIRLIDLD